MANKRYVLTEEVAKDCWNQYLSGKTLYQIAEPLGIKGDTLREKMKKMGYTFERKTNYIDEAELCKSGVSGIYYYILDQFDKRQLSHAKLECKLQDIIKHSMTYGIMVGKRDKVENNWNDHRDNV